MAKYQVAFSCGHTEEKVLFGKVNERESRIEYWEKHGTCSECYKAQQEAKRNEENMRAARKAEINGRAKLTGSEKQVKWATTIRENIMGQLDQILNKSEGAIKIQAHLNGITEARFWIDNRSYQGAERDFGIKIAKEIGLAKIKKG